MTLDVDEHPEDQGRYLLTGSANLLENKRVTDALPDRAVYIRLWPLAQDEIAGSRSSTRCSVEPFPPSRRRGSGGRVTRT